MKGGHLHAPPTAISAKTERGEPIGGLGFFLDAERFVEC
jgi:hypothetical protein